MTMTNHRWPAGPLLSCILACTLVCSVGLAVAADDPNPAKAEADLKAVRSQIDKVREEMERDAGKRTQLSRDLEESETA
jgi:septal ring factor EnvC (AmiA/AmiB activator)